MSTPSSTVTRNFVHEIAGDRAEWYSSNRLSTADLVINSQNAKMTMACATALIPIIKDRVESIELFESIDSEYSPTPYFQGLILCDKHGKVLLHIIHGMTIGMNETQISMMARDILELVDVPKSVFTILNNAVRNKALNIVEVHSHTRSYAVKLTFS